MINQFFWKVNLMEIQEIIKESFIFPSQNLEKLVIYIVLTFVIGLLLLGGFFSMLFALTDAALIAVIGVILLIVALIINLILSGYQIDIIWSGIEFEEEAPAFDWKNNLKIGIKDLILGIVYFIVPAIIVLIVAFILNIPRQIIGIAQQSAVTSVNATTAVSTIPQATVSALGTSFVITFIVAVILFILFAFIHTMGESRLAKTDSLTEGINIIEAFKDIGRIGAGKVIAVILLVIIISMVITGILGFIYGFIPQLTILSIFVTPYLAFFNRRAIGLLYSEIVY